MPGNKASPDFSVHLTTVYFRIGPGHIIFRTACSIRKNSLTGKKKKKKKKTHSQAFLTSNTLLTYVRDDEKMTDINKKFRPFSA